MERENISGRIVYPPTLAVDFVCDEGFFSSFIKTVTQFFIPDTLSHNWIFVTFQFQVLASDMSDNNREACAGATKPLIDSVESLTAYALSPEFAPVPAKISDEVR